MCRCPIRLNPCEFNDPRDFHCIVINIATALVYVQGCGIELAYVWLLLQYVNVTCFVAANVYVLAGACHWFSPFVIAMG